MENLNNINTPNNQLLASLSDVGEIDRKRLSGAAIRSFVNISNLWGLTEKEKLVILGAPARSTFHSWVSKATKKQSITLPLDVLLRISATLGIHKAISIIFHNKEQGIKWLASPNAGIAFGGQSPKEMMLSGTQDGLMQVRRYLDAWRGGSFSSAGASDEENIVNPDDVVIIG